MTAADRVVWVAGRDLVAHARRGREPRTLCGRPPVDERWAWPADVRCAECETLTVAVLELAGTSAARTAREEKSLTQRPEGAASTRHRHLPLGDPGGRPRARPGIASPVRGGFDE